jgi:hypothetical protein
MKTLIATTAALLTLATGAAAQSGEPSPAERALAHFNQDRQGNEIVESRGPATEGTTVSTRSGDALSRAFERFNAQVDGQNPARLRGTQGATATGTNTLALDTLAAIAHENRDDQI